jgi:hypothetical protein
MVLTTSVALCAGLPCHAGVCAEHSLYDIRRLTWVSQSYHKHKALSLHTTEQQHLITCAAVAGGLQAASGHIPDCLG